MTSLEERLLEKEARLRSAGEKAAAHHYEDVQRAGRANIAFADDIAAVIGIVNQLGAKCEEAAAELRRLKGEVERREAALRPFAKLIDLIESTSDHFLSDGCSWDLDAGVVKLGDLRRARDLLSPSPSKGAAEGWQAIETVPKDPHADSIDLYGSRVGRVTDCHWADTVWESTAADGHVVEIDASQITHWRRKPSPPSSGKESALAPHQGNGE